MSVDHHLATYGTLAPGRPNHHQLAGLRGRWLDGTVVGRLTAQGWGSAMGYPALTLTADGEEISVHLFISTDLPDHWQRLDAFEGSEYRRCEADVRTGEGVFVAWIYLDASG